MSNNAKIEAPAIICFKPKPQAKIRLFAFPYAGAGANIYRDWDLGDDVEIWALQYPGREWRRQQPAATHLEALALDLLSAIHSHWPEHGKVAFWGYSMGAIVAHNVAQVLQSMGLRPYVLLLAASRAPHLFAAIDPIHLLNDAEFTERLRELGGMPDLVMQEPALLELALPVLRSDFALLVAHHTPNLAPVACPLNVYGGTQDSLANRAQLAAWKTYTSADFSLRLFNGNHFFMNQVRGQLFATLRADVLRLLHQPQVRAPLTQVAVA